MIAEARGETSRSWWSKVIGKSGHRHAWKLIQSESLLNVNGDRIGKRYTSECACGEVKRRTYYL